MCVQVDALGGDLLRDADAAAHVELLEVWDAPCECGTAFARGEQPNVTQPTGTAVEMQAADLEPVVRGQREDHFEAVGNSHPMREHTELYRAL